jgi:hypothetical protein
MLFTRKEKIDLNSLRTVFDSQRKTLLEKGYPALLGMSFESFNATLESSWNSFSEKTNALEITMKGNISLLLVSKQGDVKEKMKKINGHTELDFSKIETDNANEPNPWNILLDVEDGATMVAKSAKEALKRFEKEKRFALNLDESIALLTHYPETLKHHYFISAGAFYHKENEPLPLLWLLDEDKNPELHYAWFDIAHGSYGAGSYAINIK